LWGVGLGGGVGGGVGGGLGGGGGGGCAAIAGIRIERVGGSGLGG